MNTMLCRPIYNNEFVVNGMLDEKCIGFCCNALGDVPQIRLMDTAEMTIDAFFKMREEWLEKASNYQGCRNCTQRASYKSKSNPLCMHSKISFINLSMYPSPCQGNCIYCTIRQNRDMMTLKKQYENSYHRLFDCLKTLKKTGCLEDSVLWQISCGEISIHPFKREIYGLIENGDVIIYSNCFVFDEEIVKLISHGKRCKLNFSIDCGCAETWKAVKGVDNFDAVITNLSRYTALLGADKIDLKYIFMPGINNKKKDYYGVIDIMKRLTINRLIITPDFERSEMVKDIEKAKEFLRLLSKNGLECKVYYY